MRKKILFLFLFAAGFSFMLCAQPPSQDRTALEKERQDIQKELQDMQALYNKVKGQTKQSLSQLNLIKRKINLQEQYINSINRELRMIDDDIYRSNIEIYRLQKQLDTLKIQYARTVVYAYKNRSNYDYVNFIFSASSFNDALKRIAYLKSYRAYREKQVTSILETQQLIAQRKQQQLGRKQQKNTALQNQTKQVSELAVQKKEKDQVVNELKSKEKDIQKQIAAKKKKDRDLQNAITSIVRRDIEAAKKESDRLAAEEAKKNLANTPVTNPNNTNTSTNTPVRNVPVVKKPASYLELNDKEVALGASFANNRGKLPWPVDNGVVAIHFGSYTIEGTLLKGDNPGITIATQVGSNVKSVFDGEVRGVYNLGDGMAVTIRHGKYFTTYSNLTSVSVTKGSMVKTGQSIGKAGKDDDGGGGQIDFILMIETKEINPEPWLRR
jgi:septal ring factor EnvC (AmiA/AmiB activator)